MTERFVTAVTKTGDQRHIRVANCVNNLKLATTII